ncbi:MAG: LSM domain-containing protein [Candidatus Sigynarchaeota archaeon]
MRPLDLLGLNLNRAVTIQIKRNQRYVGTLTGFDEHLNMYLENVKNEYFEVPEEEELEEDDDDSLKSLTPADKPEPRQPPAVPEKHEEMIGNIILRGDNVIFLRIDRPVFLARQPQRIGYGKPIHDAGGRRDYPPRRDQGSHGGRRDYPPRRDGGGGRRDYPPRREGSGHGGSRRDGSPRRDNWHDEGGPRKPQGKPAPRRERE